MLGLSRERERELRRRQGLEQLGFPLRSCQSKDLGGVGVTGRGGGLGAVDGVFSSVDRMSVHAVRLLEFFFFVRPTRVISCLRFTRAQRCFTAALLNTHA